LQECLAEQECLADFFEAQDDLASFLAAQDDLASSCLALQELLLEQECFLVELQDATEAPKTTVTAASFKVFAKFDIILIIFNY
jgi:hypothetical protein